MATSDSERHLCVQRDLDRDNKLSDLPLDRCAPEQREDVEGLNI